MRLRASNSPVQTEGRQARVQNLSVLVATEITDVSSLLLVWCEAHHISHVRSETDAFAALSLLRFDLAVVDGRMLDGAGLQIIKRLKKSQPWVKILPFPEPGADWTLRMPLGNEQLPRSAAGCRHLKRIWLKPRRSEPARSRSLRYFDRAH